MKKTWKYVLAALAVSAILGGSLVAQTDDGIVVLGKTRKPAEPSGSGDAAGAVRLGAGASPAAAFGGNRVTPIAGEEVPDASNAPPTIEPSGIQYSQPAGGFYGANPYGEFAAAGSVGYAVSDDPRQVLFRVGRRNGDIYGLNEGFTNLSAFVPYFTEADSALWFFQPRLVITDQGRGAANLGFGHRAYSHELDRVFSFSTWYDYDTGHEGNYHQVGASFAMIGRNTTFRANGNWVVSDDEQQVGTIPVGSTRLQNGMVVQDVVQLTEVAYNQADFEVSTPIPFLEKYGFEMGGGAYFLFGSDGDDAAGAKARVEAQVTEDVWVNAILSNDRIFDTNVSVNLEVTVPNAPASRWFRRNKVRDSLFASDRRYYRVATDITRRAATTPVMGMGSGGGVAALMLAIIDPNVTDDPTMAFGGSGTEDDPFKSLLDYTEEADAVKDDFAIVFVRRRTDGTDVNLDTTVTLLDNQALLGEGIEHSLTNLGLTGITLPGATDGLAVPLLSNANAAGLIALAPTTPIVTLANANQVAGFTIDGGGTAAGIVGTGIDGFSINNVSTQNVTNGIQIVSDTLAGVGTGMGIIRDNMISGIGLGSTQGVSIEHTDGLLSLIVDGNTITDFRGEDANSNGVLDLSEDTNMNMVLDPGEDIDFDGRLDLSEDLNMDGMLNAGFGLRVVASGSSTILANDPAGTTGLGITGNTFTTNGTGSSIEALDTSSILLDFVGNTATGSTGADSIAGGKLAAGGTDDPVAAGFRFLADGGSIGITDFTGNSAVGGAATGGIFQTFSGGTIMVSNPLTTAFDTNAFTGNALDGMFAEADSGMILFDQISGSVFDGNGDDGLDLQTTGGGSLTVTEALVGNSYTGNGDNGLEITGGLGGVLDVDIGDSSVTDASPVMGNGGAGVFIGTTGGTLLTSLNGVTATGNGGSGAVISLDGGTLLLDSISDNTLNDNGKHGLAIINNDGGTLITPFVSDNDFSNNAEASLFIGGTGPTPGEGVATTGVTDLGSVTRNNFNRDVRGTDGIQLDANDQRIIATLTRNTFVGRAQVLDAAGLVTDPGAGRGIGGRISGSSTGPGGPGGLAFTVGTAVPADENSFSANGDAHIGIRLEGNTTNVIDIANSRFMGSFNGGFGVGDDPTTARDDTPLYVGDGVHLIVNDTAVLTGSLIGSRLSGNANNGLELEVIGNNDAGNDPTMPAARIDDFEISSNVFGLDPTLPDTDPDFALNIGNGADGIAVFRDERGQFNRMVIWDNLVNGNGRNGILISSAGANQLNLLNMLPDSVSMSENTITNNGADGIEFRIGADADVLANLDLNVIDNNGLNGIQVAKQINDAKDSRSITGMWTRNMIRDNGDDGLDLEGLLGNILNDPIAGSLVPIPGAGTFPQYGLVIGDVAINPVGVLSPMGNVITGNAADGVQITGGGVATIGNNVITGNGTLTAVPGLDAADGATGSLRVIHAGIRVEGSEYDNGSIISSGATDATVDDLTLSTAFQEVLAFSNFISLNNADGVQFLVEGGAPSFDFQDFTSDPALFPAVIFDELDTQTLRLINNEITQNAGRGVDILVRPGDNDPFDSDNLDPNGTPQSVLNSVLGTVTMIGNHVKGNALEGVYIVTTSDEDTNQILPSFVDPGDNDGAGPDAPDGIVGATARLNIEFHANQVIGNGEDVVDFPATGLVVRVGSTGPLYGPFFPGGFATDGFNPEDLDGDGILDNDLDGDGYLDSVEPVFGGIAMSATGNIFDGNFGDDILFHGFTSTVDPVTSAGTWTPPTFDMMTGMLTDPGVFLITAYQGDPLSRLDLNFTGNFFNSIEANNEDATVGTFGEPGAYYDNAEGTFKSRLFDDSLSPGPFSNAARGRNAQRLASRWVTGPFPLSPDPSLPPDFGAFLYPGMGNSTFRVRGGDNFFTDQGLTTADGVSPIAISDVFILDTPADAGDPDLVDSLFEAHGVFFILGPVVSADGALPWGWGDLKTIPALPPIVAP